MTASAITVEATLQPDGVTLQLANKLALPPGRVTVIVQSSEVPVGPTMLEVLDRIQREQVQLGRRQMTEEEMDTEIARMRAEDDASEERWREIWSQTRTPTTRTGNP